MNHKKRYFKLYPEQLSSEGWYDNGKKTGKWTYYNSDGDILGILFFINGIDVTEKEWMMFSNLEMIIK